MGEMSLAREFALEGGPAAMKVAPAEEVEKMLQLRR
jgi:hypothetical protein